MKATRALVATKCPVLWMIILSRVEWWGSLVVVELPCGHYVLANVHQSHWDLFQMPLFESLPTNADLHKWSKQLSASYPHRPGDYQSLCDILKDYPKAMALQLHSSWHDDVHVHVASGTKSFLLSPYSLYDCRSTCVYMYQRIPMPFLTTLFKLIFTQIWCGDLIQRFPGFRDWVLLKPACTRFTSTS